MAQPPTQSRRHGFHLFGPILFFDLLRTSRRGRYIVLRLLYALVLLGALCLVYSRWASHGSSGFLSVAVPWREMPRFAEQFFYSFLFVQFAAVFLLTPAYTAGAIAEEKERRTLDFLLATDLSSREIILGKLGARLANMLLLLLTGLPFLSLLQFLGGVDPELVFAGFGATALTVLSLGSLSILLSIRSAKAIDAIAGTYFYTALFLLFSPCIPGLSFGNIFVAWGLLELGWTRAAANRNLLGIFLAYAMVHSFLFWLFFSLAIRWLRGELRRQESRLHQKVVAQVSTDIPGEPLWGLPPMYERALLWKELHLESGSFLRRNPVFHGWLLLFRIFGFLLLFLLPAVLANASTRGAQALISGVGTSIACMMILVVALSAAGRISREREQQTLDSLLTTALDRKEILFEKWLASILSVRLLWWLLGPLWVVGALIHILHIVALPLLLVAWLVYASFAASLGLFFSVRCRSTARATVYTLLTLFVASIGALIIGAYGLDAPSTFWGLAFDADNVLHRDFRFRTSLLAVLIGLPLHAVTAWALWERSAAAFSRHGLEGKNG